MQKIKQNGYVSKVPIEGYELSLQQKVILK